MKRIYGIDMEKDQYSKLIFDIPDPDVVIKMGCNVTCPAIEGAYEEDWGIDDPTGKGDNVFLEAIDTIERKILELKAKISCSE